MKLQAKINHTWLYNQTQISTSFNYYKFFLAYAIIYSDKKDSSYLFHDK